MKIQIIPICILLVLLLTDCSGLYEGESGDLEITVTPGDEWIHAFSSTTHVPPTYAIWIEDEAGKYITTVYVTKKAGTEGWIFNSGNRRKESLPVWAHSRNIMADDGIYLPTKEAPMPDAVTSATPKEQQTVYAPIDSSNGRFMVYCEINHSTDFNDTWPKDAAPGTDGWSGGEEGSGQPSLVYKCLVDTAVPGPWELYLYGCGDAAGEDGNITEDWSSHTSALKILNGIEVGLLP